MSLRKYTPYILLALLVLAAGKGAFALGQSILLNARGPLDADSANYFIIGRTILNGFSLYRDHFDVQPPGIFLLAALSLVLTGGEKLTTILIIFMLSALPITFAALAWHRARKADTVFRCTLALLAFVIGVLLVLYLEERAPTVETQLFGGFLSVMFALAMLHHPNRFHWFWTPACSLLLLGSIILKEPFLLSNAAVALLIARDRTHFLLGFIVPLVIGCIAGVLLLLLLGMLVPYVDSLHTTFIYRSAVSTTRFGPVSYRILSYYILFQNVTNVYVAAPLLGYLLLFFWSRAPAYRAVYEGAERIVMTITLFAAVACGAGILTTIHRMLLHQYAAAHHVPLQDGLLPVPITLFLLSLPFLASLPLLYRRCLLRSVLLTLVALGLTALAVGSSVYSGNHFAFAVPAYAAVAILFIHESAVLGRATPAFLVGVILTLVTVTVYQPNPSHLLYLKNRQGYTREAQRERTDRLDALLDACNVRQFHNEALPEFAMARHSPFGPLILPYEYMGQDHPLSVQTAEQINQHANVVVATRDYARPSYTKDHDRVVETLRRLLPVSFTTDAPPCAAPFAPIDGVTLWFRKDVFSKIQ
ncbi:MAG TPA: hypothetical protein VI873_02120 [Candidatus Peribacteraceae bacterium]|nr:hypothetical protein [Candidatus Peribacteraceae bacterium]